MDEDISSAKVWKWVGIIAGSIAVAVIAAWGIALATSGIRGHGGVVRKNNDSNNQIEAQHTFDALFADVKSYKTKIGNAAALLKANPGDPFEAQVLAGLTSGCSDAVQQYNADANDTTMKEWRSSSLPASINPSDYCEVTP